MTRAALLSLLLLVAGCGQGEPRKLTVGVVNTERVVSEMPEFRDINLSWAAETGSFLSSIPKSKEELDQRKLKELNDRIQHASKSWQARSSKFYEDAYRRITSASEQVARERGLDIVVIDTMHLPAVQYTSGENVTTDILIKLNQK
ncbi:OmpH family outer membrane protein [bacterium CPR1]|nr:OmpH family outer membrane protein [bacterium CPR1]